MKIANCESSYNPNNVNYEYWEDSNGTALGLVGAKYYPSGLFQHLTNYYPARAAKYGYSSNVFDAYGNAHVTAAMFAEGHSNLWQCK